MTDGHRQFHATQSLFSVNLAQSHFNGALSHIYTATYRLLMQHSCVSMQHSRSSMQHSRICMQHSRISMQHSAFLCSTVAFLCSTVAFLCSTVAFLCSTDHFYAAVAFPCSRGGPYRPPYQFTLKQLRLSLVNEMPTNSYAGPRLKYIGYLLTGMKFMRSIIFEVGFIGHL